MRFISLLLLMCCCSPTEVEVAKDVMVGELNVAEKVAQDVSGVTWKQPPSGSKLHQ